MGSPWCCVLVALVAVLVHAVSGAPTLRSDELFPLSVVHMNNFHARFEQIAPSGAPCKRGKETTCVGGIARVVAMARQLLSERPNPLLLNAGGDIEDTLWYSVRGWNVTADFMNRLPWDAFVPGYHEFRSMIPTTISYIQALNAPVVFTNDDSEELSVREVIKRSVVVERAGRKIGIVGILTLTAKVPTTVAQLFLRPEEPAVKMEVENLKKKGVHIIVVLSHSGIDVDLELAKRIPDVDLIVGGLLNTGTAPDENPQFRNYPIIVTQSSGRKVAIVRVGSFSRYLGNLTAYFDAADGLVSAEGNPIYLDQSVEPDAETLAAVEPLAKALEDWPVVGRSAVLLEQNNGVCDADECNLGSFVADAYAHAFTGKGPEGSWTRAAIGITNAGSLRASIAQGDVTVNDVYTAMSYHKILEIWEVRGVGLRRLLERAVASPFVHHSFEGSAQLRFHNFLQVSGLHVVYNINLPVGERVCSVKALCHACLVPKYEPLEDDKWYPVVLNKYMHFDYSDVLGKDVRDYDEGPLDFVAVVEYLKVRNPVVQAREERIKFVDSAEEKERLCVAV